MESLKFSATAKLLLLLLWVSEGEGMRTCGGGGRGRGLRLRTLSADSGMEFWSKLQPTVSSYIFGPVFNLSSGAFCLLWVCFVSLLYQKSFVFTKSRTGRQRQRRERMEGGRRRD